MHDNALNIHYEKYDQQGSVLYCKQQGLLQILATYCGHFQGSVL